MSLVILFYKLKAVAFILGFSLLTKQMAVSRKQKHTAISLLILTTMAS